MTEETTACEHANIEYDVAGLTQPGTNIIHTDIAARCADCGVMMRWLGRFKPQGEFNEPFVSDDGLWLTLPMIPEGENAFRLLIPTQ